MKTNFVPYNSLSKTRLKEISSYISQLSQDDLREAINEYLRGSIKFDNLGERILNFNIVPTSINGVQNAAIILKYKKKSIRYSNPHGDVTVATADIVKINGSKSESTVIPVIFLYNDDVGLDLLSHEKVHLCQDLLDSHYPLSEEEFELFNTRSRAEAYDSIRESKGEAEAKRFAIDSTCYTLWKEAEAIFYEGITDWNKWLTETYVCARSFEVLKSFEVHYSWNEEFGKIAFNRFSDFCAEMQMSVGWVKEMLGKRKLLNELCQVSDKMNIEDAKREQMNSLNMNQESHKKIKIGRNQPCHCGSGKKYKKCCLKKDT
jgi:hypothetical protein